MPGRVYLDHASTTPLRTSARAALEEFLHTECLGDPSRFHSEAARARHLLEEARERIAHCLGARPREVILTSGATESIASTCFGASIRGPHSVLSSAEHAAVRQWAERGPTTTVGIDRYGVADPAELLSAATSETGIIHLQWINHEVGAVQPVEALAALCAERGLIVHVDGAQAGGHIAIDFAQLGATALSLSGHKLGGPQGTGLLLIKRGKRLDPLLLGGDQERARRGGMENLMGALGLAAAIEEASTGLNEEIERQRALTDQIRAWAEETPGVALLGSRREAAAHLVCIGFEEIEPQPLVIGLDAAGIAVHSGSSCSSEALEPSPVLAAMGVDAHRSMRISVGWSSTQADIDRVLLELPAQLDRLRALRR